ncbi:DeoR family transcriptional regulator [Paucibacter sp. APW11]|uniref:DeoR family transcriptional regulator n=1 Tax=Roseateles aquae TaxID=3077235 RepID=A0ABU3P928_9BURK|nr:DeoR family transcriptional regulator [Paucibacter sp. APW11]MDT8999076.1 DeoR family transcriptional regulator [Paucibacter sp. APW11]
MRNTSQRREQILKLLMEQGSVQVSDLVEMMGVSAVTIRHDLDHFEGQGLVTRNYGGAFFRRQTLPEQDIRQRDSLNPTLKERIGARAAEMITPGDNIIIDSGTTTHQLARYLRDRQDLTVMTNGLNIVSELAEAEGVQVMLTGGVLRKQSLSFQGSQAEASLAAYSFDKLFLGVDGFDLQFGITTHSEREASLNRKMVERSRRTVVLTDSSKFGRVSLHRIIGLDRVQAVITDGGISAEYREGLQRLGIELILVD